MGTGKADIQTCQYCGSEDINTRTYGINPEFVIVACFGCMKMYIIQFDHMYLKIDLGDWN